MSAGFFPCNDNLPCNYDLPCVYIYCTMFSYYALLLCFMLLSPTMFGYILSIFQLLCATFHCIFPDPRTYSMASRLPFPLLFNACAMPGWRHRTTREAHFWMYRTAILAYCFLGASTIFLFRFAVLPFLFQTVTWHSSLPKLCYRRKYKKPQREQER